MRAWLHAADRSRWADALDMIATFAALTQLPRVAVATDVVAAEHDGVAVPEHMAQIADALPEASFRVIAGARHLAPLQRPDEVARTILAGRP